MIHTLAVQNYRTLRDFVVPLERLNLITGPNGSGKSNVYKSLRLLAETAEGGVVGALAREGGLKSTLWAGPEVISRAMRSGEVPVQGTRRKQAVSLSLGFAGDDFGYAIDLGLPTPSTSAFGLDPQIKTERIWAGPAPRPAALLIERKNGVVQNRDDDGAWQMLHDRLSSFDSMLAHLADPRATPELLALRERIRSWRFYDHFRTDALAPARQPQVGTHTTVLGHDGADLAAALQTIREIGDGAALDEAVHDAFPGAAVHVEVHDGLFETTMPQHGLLRPLKAVELSDGTLRYLLWVAALLSPRPPELLVLNEPETSLHADLLPALGRLIAQAAEYTQVVVVSHALRLIDALQVAGCRSLVLEKDCGETRVVGLTAVERPEWRWLPR
jgi:predicted ATPase